MATWKLIFRAPRENRPSLDAIANAISSVLGAPVETWQGEVDGNPYDTFSAQASLKGQHARAAIRLEANVQQGATSIASDPINGDVFVYVEGLPTAFADKLATWRALRAAFAAIGYTDDTWPFEGDTIIDEAERFGHHEAAADIRAERDASTKR